MRTKDFCSVIERAILDEFQEELEFETVPYLDATTGEPSECLGIVLVKNWHFATIVAKACHVIATDDDAIFEHGRGGDPEASIIDTLEDFSNIVGGMKVAPYMQWTCIYFPSLTEEQVLGSTEAGHGPDLVTDTAVGRDPVTGLLGAPGEISGPENVLAWNSGRPYGQQGQRIGAVLKDDGDIVFCDIDRGIYGIIDSTYGFSKSTIQDAYDNGYYQNDLTSDDEHVVRARNAAEQL